MLDFKVAGAHLGRSSTLIMLVAWLLAGCAGQSNLADDVAVLSKSTDDLSPAAAALLQDAKSHARTRASGAAVGALGGLATGVLMSMTTRDHTAKAAYIAGGLSAGAALGYAGGAYVDSRNQQAAGQQTALKSMIQGARQDAARYEQDRAQAQVAIEQSQEELVRLNSEQTAGQATVDARRRQAKNLDATAVSLRSINHELTDNIKLMQQDAGRLRARGEDTVALDEERAALQAQQTALASQYRQLLAVVDTVPQPERPILSASLQ